MRMHFVYHSPFTSISHAKRLYNQYAISCTSQTGKRKKKKKAATMPNQHRHQTKPKETKTNSRHSRVCIPPPTPIQKTTSAITFPRVLTHQTATRPQPILRSIIQLFIGTTIKSPTRITKSVAPLITSTLEMAIS